MSFEPVDLHVYDQLVTQVYKIGTGESTAQDFLGFYGAVFPNQGSSILGFDHQRPARDIFAFAGFDPAWLASYADHYSKIHPYAHAITQRPPLTMSRGTDYVSDEDLKKTEYYNDYLKPLGDLSEARGMMVFKEEDRFLMWSNLYSPKYGDEAQAAEHFLELLTPHLRRSFELARQFDLQGQVSDTLEGALSTFASAIFICSADLTIKFANAAGESALSAGNVVSGQNGRLRFASPAISMTMREKVRGFALADFGAEARKGELFVPINAHLAPSMFAFVTPLPEEENSKRSIFGTFLERPVLIMLIDPGKSISPREDIVQIVFGLTQTEAKLACALGQGMTPIEFAEARDVSKNTVRVQTQSLMGKMGARRQSDVTRMLATAFAGMDLG